MKIPALFIRLAVALCVLMPPLAGAQTPLSSTTRPSSISVFLDCNFYCDEDFIRTEINYVNWVRDRAVSDVHVLGTAQSTGSGGREYTLTFFGLRDFNGMNDTLRYVGGSTETDDERRKGLARVLKYGLVRYIARTTISDRMTISVTGASASDTKAAATRDPWNAWVFRASMNSFARGDANSKFNNINGNVRAKRTTEAWKLEFNVNENYNQSDFTIEEEKSTFITRNYNFNQLAVKSLSPRLSAGLRSFVGSSTYDNKKLSMRITPAVEYDLFPYQESTRRMLTAQYAIGYERFKYEKLTVYGKLDEGHPLHTVRVNLVQNQPWGQMDIALEGGQYLDMTNRNYGELGGDLSVRLFKGFNLNFGGNYQAIRNQLYLPAVGATPEEILTQQRQLATNYSYFMFMGMSYTFGSVLNNVVNPRFGRN